MNARDNDRSIDIKMIIQSIIIKSNKEFIDLVINYNNKDLTNYFISKKKFMDKLVVVQKMIGKLVSLIRWHQKRNSSSRTVNVFNRGSVILSVYRMFEENIHKNVSYNPIKEHNITKEVDFKDKRLFTDSKLKILSSDFIPLGVKVSKNNNMFSVKCGGEYYYEFSISKKGKFYLRKLSLYLDVDDKEYIKTLIIIINNTLNSGNSVISDIHYIFNRFKYMVNLADLIPKLEKYKDIFPFNMRIKDTSLVLCFDSTYDDRYSFRITSDNSSCNIYSLTMTNSSDQGRCFFKSRILSNDDIEKTLSSMYYTYIRTKLTDMSNEITNAFKMFKIQSFHFVYQSTHLTCYVNNEKFCRFFISQRNGDISVHIYKDIGIDINELINMLKFSISIEHDSLNEHHFVETSKQLLSDSGSVFIDNSELDGTISKKKEFVFSLSDKYKMVCNYNLGRYDFKICGPHDKLFSTMELLELHFGKGGRFESNQAMISVKATVALLEILELIKTQKKLKYKLIKNCLYFERPPFKSVRIKLNNNGSWSLLLSKLSFDNVIHIGDIKIYGSKITLNFPAMIYRTLCIICSFMILLHQSYLISQLFPNIFQFNLMEPLSFTFRFQDPTEVRIKVNVMNLVEVSRNHNLSIFTMNQPLKVDFAFFFNFCCSCRQYFQKIFCRSDIYFRLFYFRALTDVYRIFCHEFGWKSVCTKNILFVKNRTAIRLNIVPQRYSFKFETNSNEINMIFPQQNIIRLDNIRETVRVFDEISDTVVLMNYLGHKGKYLEDHRSIEFKDVSFDNTVSCIICDKGLCVSVSSDSPVYKLYRSTERFSPSKLSLLKLHLFPFSISNIFARELHGFFLQILDIRHVDTFRTLSSVDIQTIKDIECITFKIFFVNVSKPTEASCYFHNDQVYVDTNINYHDRPRTLYDLLGHLNSSYNIM